MRETLKRCKPYRSSEDLYLCGCLWSRLAFGRTSFKIPSIATPATSRETHTKAHAGGYIRQPCRIGTLADVIEDGVTGLLFDPGQPSDLAAKITWVINKPAESFRIAMAGRAEFEAKYTAERNYNRLKEIYHSVTSLGTQHQCEPEPELVPKRESSEEGR